ncbi:MAG: hypothetical protein ACK4M9_19470 [Anaerobacillus sp.]|uniref:hypothetical protein n=1 Tax=Anaerobacillus sp. TaxID=1872506 RepID=UPI00391A15F7
MEFINDIGLWFHDLYTSFRMLEWWVQIVFGLLIAIFGNVLWHLGPYNIGEIEEMIELDYMRLANRHFFVSVRFSLKNELKARAQSNVFGRNLYIPISYYLRFISSIMSFLIASVMLLPYAMIYFMISFSLLFGYVNMKLPVLSPSPPPGVHHVTPHQVEPYVRNGVEVRGYWRGGENGYWRTNPDGNPLNNFGGN